MAVVYLLAASPTADTLREQIRDCEEHLAPEFLLHPQWPFSSLEAAQRCVEQDSQAEYEIDVASALKDGDVDHGMAEPGIVWEAFNKATDHVTSTGRFWDAFDHHLEIHYRISEVLVDG